MTKSILQLTLTCGDNQLQLGGAEAGLDITKITGLESSDLEVGLSDLAVVDGSSLDGRHIKARPIHIEASYKSLSGLTDKRETLVRFFNPKLSGTLTATLGTRSRSIGYELEGWTLKEQRNLDGRVGFIADLICPDPHFYGPEKTPDWTHAIMNNGDVEAGWHVTLFGPFSNPKVTLQETGEYMRVIATLKAGDTMTISTEARKQTILINGESAFHLIDRKSTPFKLPVGTSTVTITADSGSAAGSIKFREPFFGI